jgi:hypothetical protein
MSSLYEYWHACMLYLVEQLLASYSFPFLTHFFEIVSLVRTISVHYAYLDCYHAVDFETKSAPNSTASIAVDLKVFNGDCEHTYPL